MTKFILNGGFDPETPDRDGNGFYEEIVKDAPDGAKVLLVPFVKDEERIPVAIVKVTADFKSAAKGKELLVEVATAENFINQARDADILYFHGGTSLKLLDALKRYPELESVIEGKIVAGDSAGANVWCKYFYSPHADEVFEGLGFLPLKLIPHYTEELVEKLDGTDPNLETILLPEYQHRVFEI